MDVRPDRATKSIKDEILRACAMCREQNAALVYVRFDQPRTGQNNYLQWRRNKSLVGYIEEQGVGTIELPPDPIQVSNWRFDPREHFAAWRERDSEQRTARRAQAFTAVTSALTEYAVAPDRWQQIAERLNREQVPTLTGRLWKPDAVRKFVARNNLTARRLP